MASPIPSVLSHLRRVVARRCEGGLSDADLLARFARDRDQAAFEVLVWRHGPMVYGVGRRVLGNVDDAEDVLQAVFLVLLRQAGSIGRRQALASWLYRVTYRTALRLRSRRARRSCEALSEDGAPADPETDDIGRRETLAVLDEELQALPQKYRAPLILSYLRGLTNREIATELGCPVGTVFTRLARGRDALRKRLRRRGLSTPAVAVGSSTILPEACLPLRRGLAQATVANARALSGDPGFVDSRLTETATLAEEIARTTGKVTGRPVAAAALLIAVAASVGIHLAAERRIATEAGGDAMGESFAAVESPRGVEKPAEKRDRPHVVEAFPPDGASGVDLVTEIRLRFDRPMDPNNTLLNWTARTSAGFRPRGELRYDAAKHEFVFPVLLSPGVRHELQANESETVAKADGAVIQRNLGGFRSEGGVAATAYSWSFTAGAPPAGQGPAPRVTAVSPPSDSEVALLNLVEVTYDRPMDPRCFGLALSGGAEFSRSPELLLGADYDARQNRFSLLLRLPPNWNGVLLLSGFRSADGVEAEPLRLNYRTLQENLSKSVVARFATASRSAELRRIVERARQAGRDVRSVSEDVRTTMLAGIRVGDRYQMIESQGATFRKDGAKFVAVVDDIMHIPFRIGCDGTTCWLRRRDELVSLPVAEVADKNVQFCDPFNSNVKADTAIVVRDMRLELLAEGTIRGRACYRIRSWPAERVTNYLLAPVRTWWIDKESYLPVRVESAGPGLYAVDFIRRRVNEAITDAEFRPESGAGVERKPPEPLADGFTRRFLKICDGSSGTPSARLGDTDGKKERSSGLN